MILNGNAAMINPATIRLAAYGAIILAIFFTGFKANGYLWSARYDKLEAAHVTAVAEQRERLLTRQQLINDETEAREIDLLRDLAIQREQYDLLEQSIATTPIVINRQRRCEAGDLDPVPSVDWTVFGRLYDSASSPRSPAESDASDRSDATVSDGAAETG